LKLHYSRAGQLLPKTVASNGGKSVVTTFVNHWTFTSRQWTASSFTGLRFGFEITVYVASRWLNFYFFQKLVHAVAMGSGAARAHPVRQPACAVREARHAL